MFPALGISKSDRRMLTEYVTRQRKTIRRTYEYLIFIRTHFTAALPTALQTEPEVHTHGVIIIPRKVNPSLNFGTD